MSVIDRTGLYNNKFYKQWEMWDVELLDEPILLGICSWSEGEDGLEKFKEDYRDYWVYGLTIDEAEEGWVEIH